MACSGLRVNAVSDLSLIEEIFVAALAKVSPQERAAFLDGACQGDLELRRQVERLLDAHPKGKVLEPPPVRGGEATYVVAEHSGAVVAGRYKLLEPIGEGGMGSVWAAEQTQPVRRKVAIKLIKAGMDSKTVLARFEVERQALALMDHPNIAKVLDGGVSEQGRPFFVMEYVKGVPLTQYCDDAKLTIEERLALFIPVCQAVQHAHQKGIVHRDLKPTNVLVCLYDGKPVPKVIDFGLAKAMHQPLTEHTLFTAHGAMLGTPIYMSPEQAELNNLDVDTRTDIYSLGVIMYELLTGTTPLEKRRFQEAAWQEMLRVIKEEDPPRPSTRLSGSATLPSVASQRRTEPVKLSRLLRGELDWIVMKALEKERNRRYETANGFAQDVDRFLHGEPVSAVPPSARYRLSKFLRKHRTAVAGTALILLGLLAGIGGTTWGMVRADQARREAETAEGRERDERNKADAARHQVELNAAGLRVDLNVARLKGDEKLGLLQGARALKNLPPEFRDLRQYCTLALMAYGQDYARFLPPINHEGREVFNVWLSSDRRTMLSHGQDLTARLWDARTGRPIAILQKENERVVNCGYSPDGQTVFTDDRSGIVRLWDVAGVSVRAHTDPRQNRYVVSYEQPPPIGQGQIAWEVAAVQLSQGRLLTQKFFERRKPFANQSEYQKWEGPVELWDTATGRMISRLDNPKRPESSKFQFAEFLFNGRWVALHCASHLLICSAADGSVLKDLNYPSTPQMVSVSPNGRRIGAIYTESSGRSAIRFTEITTWREELLHPPSATLLGDNVPFQFLTDDDVLVPGTDQSECFVLRCGRAEPLVRLPTAMTNVACIGDLLHIGGGRIVDLQSGRRLQPPSGLIFHPDIAKFAKDGRFALSGDAYKTLIDTRTGKQCTLPGRFATRMGSMPGVGVLFNDFGTWWPASWTLPGFRFGVELALLPAANRLDIEPELLELWLQLAVRGEIGARGEFVAWNEQTWDGKQKQLAQCPIPWDDFPFPGHVAVDRLHWLRTEFEEVMERQDREASFRLAQQLIDRTEAAGNKAQAANWREALKNASALPGKPAPK
jgi:serine/threonine protein kinase